MVRVLLAAFGREGLSYVRHGKQSGMRVRVLDCVEQHHKQLVKWYGEAVLQVQGRRSDVREAVAREQFDAAIVHEDGDFIRTALIAQSLREAGVGHVMVVTSDPGKRLMYRRSGAHHIVIANNEEEAWASVDRQLRRVATA